jgi:dolichyl-phosphate-mannose-protein mannosyltransferase
MRTLRWRPLFRGPSIAWGWFSGLPPRSKRPAFDLRWSRFDSIAMTALLVVAGVLHLWRIGTPNALVYDEITYVDEAFRYLHGQQFFEVHPPFALLLMAFCLRAFGCSAWSWRIASAAIGTGLVAITYLLARRMFNSRAAALLAASLILGDGMFFEYSRLGLINIAYVTFAAAAYLMMFRFLQSEAFARRRLALVWMAVALGLGLASKFAVPGITWLLTVGFVLLSLLEGTALDDVPEAETAGDDAGARVRALAWGRRRNAFGMVALVGGISAACYFAAFLPHFWLKWWGGLDDILDNYHQILSFNSTFTHHGASHQDSPWWSWPLMLRPYRYWNEALGEGQMREIWGGGNPAIWWGALVAMVLAGVRAIRGGRFAWWFLVVGYLAYTALWIPVTRVLYLYSYLPALYLAILALAGILARCWQERAQWWEEVLLMLPVVAAGFLGLGWQLGLVTALVAGAGCLAMRVRLQWGGRFVCAVFLATSMALFFYFLPLWIALPISKKAIAARMWMHGSAFASWW